MTINKNSQLNTVSLVHTKNLTCQTPDHGKAMTIEQQEIQSLKKQLWRAKRDNEILKKATALFAQSYNVVLSFRGYCMKL